MEHVSLKDLSLTLFCNVPLPLEDLCKRVQQLLQNEYFTDYATSFDRCLLNLLMKSMVFECNRFICQHSLKFNEFHIVTKV